jgi:hypothetical protein
VGKASNKRYALVVTSKNIQTSGEIKELLKKHKPDPNKGGNRIPKTLREGRVQIEIGSIQ